MLGLGIRSAARRTVSAGGGGAVQPVALSPIPYQKIRTGTAGSYNVSQHASGANFFAPAPGQPALQAGVTLSAAGLLSWTTTPTPQMDNYVVIRATNLASGLYEDLPRMRVSVAQDPGVAPAPTLTALNATTIRFAQPAVPVNVPPIQVDLLEGPTSPLTSANGQVRYGAMTGLTQLDLPFATGTVRRAKLRYRIDWGDGTSFPPSFAASPESNVVTLTPGTSAPTALVPLSISPSSGPVGTIFTIALGTVDGNPAPTHTLTALALGATDVLASAVLQSPGIYAYTSTAPGALTASSLAQNGTLPNLPQTASATVSALITVPNQPAPPDLTVISSSQIDVAIPSDPPDGGAAIDRRELDYSFDGISWTTIVDPPLTRSFSSLAAQAWLYTRYRVRNSAGYSAYSAVASGQTQAAPGSSLTLNELSRDRMIYDSGAAIGRDYADIPFSGTASPGAIVQGRFYSLDDGGATSSIWADIGAADGSGNWSGSLSAVLNESWYRKEVRLKALPNVTAVATNRCCAGHIHAFWGQSEVHRLNQTSFSNTAAETLLSIAQQVDRLVLTVMTGRNSSKPLKVVGVDALPSGASLAARTITLTGTGTFEDWDIQDYQLKANFGARWKLRQCLVREVVGSLAPNYLLQIMRGGRIDTERCTMYGMPGSSLDAVIREEGSGGGTTYGKSTHKRLRITNFPADGAKVVAAEFYDSLISSKQNLKKVPVVWSNATTYALDDYVYIGVGGNIYAYASLQAGNLNNQPPTDGTSNAFWSRKAPHSDGINPTECCEKIIVRRTIVDFSQANIANGSVGITSNFRCETTAAQYILTGGIEISYSIFDRDPSSPQWPITITGGFTTTVQIERSRFTPRGSDGRVITAGSATVNWADNTVKSSGATIATPAGCVAATSVLKTNDDVVQAILHDRTNAGMAGVVHRFISTAAPYTAAISAIANTYLAERPGEKVAILFHTLSGTGFSELFNDGATARSWADDFAVHQYGTANGAHVGVASASWYASPIGMGIYYGEGFHQMVTGKDSAGVPLNVNGTGQRLVLEAGRTLPGGGTVSGQQIVCDHLWADIYDYTKTKWLLWGPHRFEINADMTDAIHLRAGGTDNQLSLAQSCRESVRAMLAKASVIAENIFLPVPFDPLGYSNGKSNGAGGWTDTAHPTDTSADGLMRWGRLHAHAMMMAAGLTCYQAPKYDQCAWAADGSMVDIWSSLGPVSTTRLKRGDAALGATFPHWGDVFGWQLDGLPFKASIVAGRTRLVPVSGVFDNWSTIKFGEGGATGQIEVPEDFVNLTYKNWPLVDVGAYGIEGLPMSVLPSAAILANTIVGAAMFSSVAGQLTYLRDNTNWPTGAAGQKLSLYFDGRLANTGGTQVLASLEGSPHLTLDCTSAGALRLTVKDSAGGAIMTTVALGTIAFGVRFKLSVSFDISTTNACWVTLNGVASQKNFTGTANGLAGSNRRFRFLTSASAANFSIGDFGELALWTDYLAGGGNPADTNLRWRVVGPPAAANTPTGCTRTGGAFV